MVAPLLRPSTTRMSRLSPAPRTLATMARASSRLAAKAKPVGPQELWPMPVALDISEKFAELRPITPGYPFIATEFTKTSQDILNGADPKQALDQAVKNIDDNQKSNNYFE